MIKGFGAMALLEELCHWGLGFEASKVPIRPSLTLSASACKSECRSQLLLQNYSCYLNAAMLLAMMKMD